MNIYIYLVVYLLTILFAYYVFRVAVRKDYEKKGGLSNYATVLEFLIFAIHANLSYTFLPAPYPEMPAYPDNQPLVAFGTSFMIIGISLMLWAMSGFGFKKAFGQDTQTLNRYGFYQYVRNPQIVFYSIAVLGMPVIWPSFYALGWILLYAIIAHMMVITEEEHLLRIYKEDYKNYCEDVPRYIPRLWRKK
ncbi:MAG: isoprenylcysteine carboxylmethyltransferase family protein [Anaerolineae bacterium]|jgi:protein-S-isoprenylcysteine O-methyltransferase Ste14|nr:isoprenylcysteine carboxylmethyltransferase family protein [Anaerolineae bacterium]MBT7072143.1 isoprenylcysteine carboxylmethyltransferase family protein [Anaerolineae bacterium]MBT7988331.1 isoprenylcysteine carboxylmethyltransferase family protein [Anaerolineae bacterium]